MWRPDGRETVSVREALPPDAESVRAVSARAERALRTVYRPSQELVQSSKARSVSRRQLVAERNAEIVGTVFYDIRGDRLHLQALAVDPVSQRQGVARVLIAHVA